MTGIIVLISFFFTALIEVNFLVLYLLKWQMPLPIEYSATGLSFIFLLIALIASLRGLFFKDSTSKKLKFLYVVTSVVWILQLSFNTHMTYFAK